MISKMAAWGEIDTMMGTRQKLKNPEEWDTASKYARTIICSFGNTPHKAKWWKNQMAKRRRKEAKVETIREAKEEMGNFPK